MNKWGNEHLLLRHKTVFLCSRLTPEALQGQILDWANALSPEQDCVLCGNHSYMEQEVFKCLLQKQVPVIWALAESLPKQVAGEVEKALRENRLLFITCHGEGICHVTQQAAFERNQWMLSMADEVVVGFVYPGGNVSRQIAGMEHVRILTTGDFPEDVASSHYKLLSSKGDLSFELMENPSGPYLKITRTYLKQPALEMLRIDKTELQQFRFAIDRAIKYWGTEEQASRQFTGKGFVAWWKRLWHWGK